MTVWAQVSVREKTMIPHGLRPWLLITCHLCHRDIHSYMCEQQNTQQAGLTSVQQPRTEQSRAWRKEKGKEEEGQREPRMPSCPTLPAMSPGMARRRQRGGVELHQSVRAMGEELSGGLQEVPSPASVTRGLRRVLAVFFLWLLSVS